PESRVSLPITTRWRCSPRWNTRPAACPTLSASSGVIRPLARPRIPSVPKYLRFMYPPAASEAFAAVQRQPRTPAINGDGGGYKAFVPKLDSKNMMTHYRERRYDDSLSRCFNLHYVQNRTPGRNLR